MSRYTDSHASLVYPSKHVKLKYKHISKTRRSMSRYQLVAITGRRSQVRCCTQRKRITGKAARTWLEDRSFSKRHGGFRRMVAAKLYYKAFFISKNAERANVLGYVDT